MQAPEPNRPQRVTTGKNTGKAGRIMSGRPWATAVETAASVEPLSRYAGMVPGSVLTTVVTVPLGNSVARRMSYFAPIQVTLVPMLLACAQQYSSERQRQDWVLTTHNQRQ